MPETFKEDVLGDPFRDVHAYLAEKPESAVKLVGNDALVISVVIAHDETPGGNFQHIDGVAIFEVEPQMKRQRSYVVLRAVNGDLLLAAPQRPVAGFDQSPASQLGHIAPTLPARRRTVA